MLQASEWKQAAAVIGCEIEVLQAVVLVESRGLGFLPDPLDKRVLLRFENHYWYRLWGRANGKPAVSSKQIVFGTKEVQWAFSPVKNRQHTGHLAKKGNGPWFSFHGNAIKEWQVFDLAYQINPNYAIQSASFGLPQIMGANYRLCGHRTAEEFFADMCESEYRQIINMCNFIVGSRLDDELRRKDWAAFAHGYNGPAYGELDYDGRLAQEYQKIKAKTVTVS